jgi:hypothetical protein
MTTRRLYIFSPVDVFGRPFGGTLDIFERLKWSVSWYDRVFIFCPGPKKTVQRKTILGKQVIAVYGVKRLNLITAFFGSAAIAWKPIFWFSFHRLFDRNATFLFEGFLSIFMLPQIFTIKREHLRRKIRVHNDEALFHLDRADTESNLFFRLALRFEALRLWVLERLFYSMSTFDRCFICNAEARRLGHKTHDTVIAYFPSPAFHQKEMEVMKTACSIVCVANFGLADNRRAICNFLDQFLPEIQARGFCVIIGGFGSELLLDMYSMHLGIKIIGPVSPEQELQLYNQSICCVVASNNRAGYKTRISTALANGLVPILHGRGALANAQDALLSVRSSKLVEMIDNKSLFILSSQINAADYGKLVVNAVSKYKNFMLH